MAKSSKKKPVEKDSGPPVSSIDDLVSALIDGIEDGQAQTLGSDELKMKIRGVIPTGCCLIDDATGRGGIPLGRLTLLQGQEAAGKTSIALSIAAECQKAGGIVLYIDVEYKLDPDYARVLGVDTDRLIISQPGYLEKAFDVMEQTIARASVLREKMGKRIPILIVLDSMNAIETLTEAKGELTDQHYAPAARVFSSALKRIIPKVSHEDVALLFISQIRTDLGVKFGSNEKTAGGKAPKFYASLVMSLKPKKFKKDTDSEEKISNLVVLECTKNQVASPFRKAEYEIIYGIGINKKKALIDWAIKLGVIEQAGAYFKMDDKSIGQGIVNVCEKLEKDTELEKEIYKRCKKEVPW